MNIEIPIIRPWTIKIPEVYRYMEQKHIESFFNEGMLRLSSFEKFKKHQDEQRHDSDEGINFIVGRSESNTVTALATHGVNSYILCTSQIFSKDLMNSFACNGCFKILNTLGFATAIANALPNFINGIEGSCIYSERNYIDRKLESFDLENYRVNDGTNNVDLSRLMGTVNEIGGTDVFFTKSLKYLNQMEYRFVWNVNYSVPEYIDIICKDAIQFCEKIS